jgi:hypothetical protein
MWLTPDEEKRLDDIHKTKPLTEKEKEAIKTFDGWKELRELDSTKDKLPPVLYNELQDILNKYG